MHLAIYLNQSKPIYSNPIQCNLYNLSIYLDMYQIFTWDCPILGLWDAVNEGQFPITITWMEKTWENYPFPIELSPLTTSRLSQKKTSTNGEQHPETHQLYVNSIK